MKRSPINRSVGLKRTSSLRRVSKKRAVDNRTYLALRGDYLSRHPFCQVFLREGGHDEAQAIKLGYVLETVPLFEGSLNTVQIRVIPPPATEIHHTNKRRGKMLLDERYWLAVSRKWHDRIESDKAWARERRYLLNF